MLHYFYRSSKVTERFRSRISFRDEFVRVGEIFIFNLDWAVGGVQCHSVRLFTPDVEAYLLYEEIESPGPSLEFVSWCVRLPCEQLVSPTPNERNHCENRLLFHRACASSSRTT